MLGYFPDAYADEILYSLCARFSSRMRYPKKLLVFEKLFGYKGPLGSVDLPRRLSFFATAIPNEHDCDVDQLVTHHTLFPYYSAFLSPEKVKRIRNGMEDNGNQRYTFEAGLSTTRVKPPQGLRYCPLCHEEELKKFGESYWHRLHQLPGVEVCVEHEVWLERSEVLVRRQPYQYEFVPVKDGVQATKPRLLDFRDQDSQDLLFIARESAWLLAHPGFVENLESWHQRYIVCLINRDLASWQGGVVYQSQLNQNFEDRFSRKLLELLQCSLEVNSRNKWLNRLLYRSASVTHPLYHILLVRFLGYRLDEFKNLPIEYHPFGEGPWPCLNPVCKNYLQLVINHVEISSARSTKHPTEKFACECGYTYFRTGPDESSEDHFRKNYGVASYGLIWEKELEYLLNQPGLSKREIGERLGIYADTVQQQAIKLGFIQPGNNSDQTRTTKFSETNTTKLENKFEAYSAEWLTVLENDAELGAGNFIRKHKRVYSWLKRNVPAWLNEHMPPPKKEKRQGLTVDWESRDEALAICVRQSAESLKKRPGRPIQITKGKIASTLTI